MYYTGAILPPVWVKPVWIMYLNIYVETRQWQRFYRERDDLLHWLPTVCAKNNVITWDIEIL